jgi:chemotaxis protein histidine kinase CheA|tara:strand:+ start:5825 stop:6898 length:1074 start_codon:yes stop_codon:yes gene_type:complete
MSESLETTLTNGQDVNVNLVDEDVMLEGLADEFFGVEPKEVLSSEDIDNEVEEAAESDEAEASETELLEEESSDEDPETEEEETEEDADDSEEVESDIEELDMEYEVPVKVDGEEYTVAMAELIKGYQTAQSSNKKSIEASAQLKEAKVLAEEATTLKAQNAELLAKEVDSDAVQLEAYDRKIQQLINDDDMFELPKWQEARRNKAKELESKKKEATRLNDEAISEKTQADAATLQATKEQAIAALDTDLPGWQDDYESVVNWAVKDLGFPEFANIVDPKVIALMYDYKSLKDSKKVAVQKRKKAPTKSVKATKPVNKKAKTSEKEKELRKRVLSGDATENQADSFLAGMVDGMFSN